jgi:hypothetical protein
MVSINLAGVSGYGVSIRVGAACIVPDESRTQLFIYEPPQSMDNVIKLITSPTYAPHKDTFLSSPKEDGLYARLS